MPTDIPLARPSSTVVLVRPTATAPEVFMVKRHASASFGSKFAFPGGVLEDSDSRVHELCRGISSEQANQVLDVEQGGLDFYSAAIRELFEESGVLLAENNLPAADLDKARLALNAGTLTWDEFATANMLQLQCDRLHYFSFLITPVGMPKRYSVRFFLTAAERSQAATHDGGELTESCWMRAAEVLQARKSKQMKVPWATRKTLKRVAQLDSTAALVDWARTCSEQGVICERPALSPAKHA